MWRSVAYLGILVLTGCAAPYTGLERDVVHTPPRFSENRIFFVPGPSAKAHVVDLKPSYEELSGEDLESAITHGQPLTIVVNGVGLPSEPVNSDVTRDIAVLLDIGAGADGSDTSIVVWYQRGVKPDQMLNFSNLVVFYEPSWDSRVAPYFRLRVIDVRQERAKETRALLEEAGKSAGSLGALVANPLLMQAASVAIKAASLVLANTSNQMLLDYSVQFFSQQHIRSSGGAGLGALRRGPFIVVGRPENCGGFPCGRRFWNNDLLFDWKTSDVLFKSDQSSVISPFISVAVVTAESIVPKLVMERSASLFKLLTEIGKGFRIEEIQQQTEALRISVNAFLTNERLKKYRTMNDLQAAVLELQKENLTGEDKSFLLRTLSDVAKTRFGSPEEATKWWEGIAPKKATCSINANFELQCPK